jgi:FkbM family methyltransferase
MKKIINKILNIWGLHIYRKKPIEEYLRSSVKRNIWRVDITFTTQYYQHVGPKFIDLMEKSKSQFRQDIFALVKLNFKRNGYFVEFGATDGIELSNTYLLEKEYGYVGILAEPNPNQRGEIKKNRKATIEERCVWRASNETLSFVDAGGLSTIVDFSSGDIHKEKRDRRKTFEVKTVSLTDMLLQHNAPAQIDYLSIDTEGSEYEILSAHDFTKYNFSVITVEHNYTNNRQRIYQLLTKNGYQRVHEELSGVDDWYIYEGCAALQGNIAAD